MRNTSSQFYKKLLGGKGELLTEHYLKRKGYKILEKNFKCKVGEADIIALYGNVLAFVEVKTRSGYEFGKPAEAVGSQKRRRYAKLASFYLLIHPEHRDKFVRFDVSEVFDFGGAIGSQIQNKNGEKVDKINYIENAFICE